MILEKKKRIKQNGLANHRITLLSVYIETVEGSPIAWKVQDLCGGMLHCTFSTISTQCLLNGNQAVTFTQQEMTCLPGRLCLTVVSGIRRVGSFSRLAWRSTVTFHLLLLGVGWKSPELFSHHPSDMNKKFNPLLVEDKIPRFLTEVSTETFGYVVIFQQI